MTRDQIRGLIGGYATGSLTDAERQAIFEAALDDQDLFDQLAAEQDLKHLLDQPGVRQRLLDSLEPPQSAWWKRPWPWAAAAAIIAIAAIFLLKPAPHIEVAKLEQPRIESAPPAPPLVKTEPQPAPRRVPKKKTEPPPQATAGGYIAPPEPAKKDSVAATGSVAPAPMAAPFAPRAQASAGALISPLLPKPFAFHYSITWTGDVIVTADADGYLRILATQNDSEITLFPGPYRQVRAGSTTRIAVPSGVDAIAIQFYASPPPPTDHPTYTDTTDLSGEVTDPNPSPDSKLLIRIAK